MTPLILRFAPSPTGNLHIGSARTAFINFIVSKQNLSSKFYIRIEDTDKERSKSEYTDNILKGLEWLGIKWDNEIQIQSDRIERHRKIALKLLDTHHAYKCICSEEKLINKRDLIKKNKNSSKKICTECKANNKVQELSEGFVIRIKLPDDGETILQDKIQGKVKIMNRELDDFILLRKDLTPTYMLSVVVDDNDLGVNFIIRGDDHLNNAFRQHFIYKYLKWNIPQYAHIPLIHGEDGSKLSKRHGAVDVLDFKKNGYLSEAVINNLILLGWSPGNESEIINTEEIIKNFNLNKLSKSSSIFNYKKLNFFNNYYLRESNNFHKFLEYCQNNEKLKKLLIKDENKIKLIFEVYKKDLNNFSEIINITDPYFNENYKYDYNEKFSEDFINLFDDIYKIFSEINIWSKENIQDTISNFIKTKNIKFPIIGKPLRFLLINNYNGPSITDILHILGKKDSIYRLNQYIERQ